jgi:hypothetical protein
LFLRSKVICVVYVDDTLLWSVKNEWIEEAKKQLQDRGMKLEVEDSVAGFLGVHIERDQTDGSRNAIADKNCELRKRPIG